METIYRKVQTENRLPEKTHVYYDTDLGKTFFIGSDDIIWKRDINWWLEEIELPTDDYRRGYNQGYYDGEHGFETNL